MRRFPVMLSLAILATATLSGQTTVLRYAHPNSGDSVAGLQADYFARKVEEYTNGAVRIEVYPDSQLGTLRDQVNLVASGTCALTHATAAAIGLLYPDFAVLDTPYLYRDVNHLLRVADPASPVMKKLGDGLLKTSGVRVLYSFYFGARQLTCTRPVRRPEDLKGVKVRAIPFPVYETAVEGLGAVPIPLDWAATPTALATRAVDGQENPVNTILTARLDRTQRYLMLTNHILSAAMVAVNEQAWKKLPARTREGITRAAREAGNYATRLLIQQEEGDLATLRARGMTVIGTAEGLDLEAFRANTRRLVNERYRARWAEYYALIDRLR